MGYLFLSLALFFGVIKGFCGKKTSGYVENARTSVFVNLFRMLLCVFISLLTVIVKDDTAHLLPTQSSLIFSAVSGFGTAFFVASWLLLVRKNSYMMIDVFLTLGTAVPMITGLIFFSEKVSIKQWFGFALLVAAVFIMSAYNKKLANKNDFSTIALLVACGLSNGIVSTSQKAVTKLVPEFPVSVFNLYTYVFAAIGLAVFFMLTDKKEPLSIAKGTKVKVFSLVAVMAAALTAHSFFITIASAHLKSAELYPLNQGSALVLSTLMASLLFKEKLKPSALCGIALCFVALLMINM